MRVVYKCHVTTVILLTSRKHSDVITVFTRCRNVNGVTYAPRSRQRDVTIEATFHEHESAEGWPYKRRAFRKSWPTLSRHKVLNPVKAVICSLFLLMEALEVDLKPTRKKNFTPFQSKFLTEVRPRWYMTSQLLLHYKFN